MRLSVLFQNWRVGGKDVKSPGVEEPAGGGARRTARKREEVGLNADEVGLNADAAHNPMANQTVLLVVAETTSGLLYPSAVRPPPVSFPIGPRKVVPSEPIFLSGPPFSLHRPKKFLP